MPKFRFEIYIACSIVLASCGNDIKQTNQIVSKGTKTYRIKKVPSITFRRNYFYDEKTYANKKLQDQLDNRNPEHSDPIDRMKASKYYSGFKKLNLIDQKLNLNLAQWNVLSRKPLKHIRLNNNNYSVKINLSNETKYSLQIFDRNKIVASSEIDFGFPPDVQFIIYDIDYDNQDEVIALYHWYIINGDNYDFYVYEINQD